MIHTFSRQELYDLVWSEPKATLAKRLGVSDVGLAKACRRADIPVPGLGYWAKLQHGKKVRRPPLPPAGPGIRNAVTITLTPPLPPDIAAQIQQERSPDRRIAVPETPADHHPLVRAWLDAQRRQLKEAKRKGQQPPTSRLYLSKTERRRLRLLSTLLNALEKRGHKVPAGSSSTHKVTVLVTDEKIDFSLYDLRPTGELVLKIEEYLDRGARVTWRDTSTKRLDDQLNRVVVGLLTAAAILRERRLKWEEAARREQAEREGRMRKEEARRQEEERRAYLIRSVQAWRQAADIRAYVDALRAAVAAGRRKIDATNLEQWTSWALARADQMDPLLSSSPLPLVPTGGEESAPIILNGAFPPDARTG